jgi:hypothetical protein
VQKLGSACKSTDSLIREDDPSFCSPQWLEIDQALAKNRKRRKAEREKRKLAAADQKIPVSRQRSR